MSFRVIMLSRAERDVEDIHAFIFESSPQNASLVVDRIAAQVRALSKMPRSYPAAIESPELGGEFHQAVVWPYRIIFEIVGKDVLVHTVRHGHRRPASDIISFGDENS